MKKLNNKGYMLVEIIMAFAITFTLLYFMMDLVLKMKNNNDDLLVETVVKTDSTIITNGLMEYAKADVTNQREADNFCTKIKVDGKTVKYDGNVIAVVDDTATISYDKDRDCSADSGRLKIKIPVSVKQMNDENFDIVLDHYYDYSAVCNPVTSYRCGDVCSDGECDNSKIYAIEYDGRCNVIDDRNGDWRVKFLEEGEHILKVNCDMNIDVFLVGGGGGGGKAGSDFNKYNAGGGGGGGHTQTVTGINLVEGKNISIVIGSGGEGGHGCCKSTGDTGGNTSFSSDALSYEVNGGNGGSGKRGGSGGSGGGNGAYSDHNGGYGGSDGEYGFDQYKYDNLEGSARGGGGGQGTTTREFGESTGDLYAGGGGGCAAVNSGGNSGDPGLGGAGGGGNGGDAGSGSSGVANTGGGGGGSYYHSSAGAGGSGIVIIRNIRDN